MGRSQLYRGRDTKTLTAQEQQLERLYDQIDRPGYRITPEQFFQTPQAMQLLDRLYGGLSDRIPPGSQIVSETPGKLTYRDAEGYEHNIIRKPDGQFTESTNRPSILPNKQQEDFLTQLQQRVQQGLTAPTLAGLPPEVQAELDALSANEQGMNDRELAELEGQLLARLYGNRVNQSSVANEAGARFAEGAGRVRQQQRADAAARSLGVRQFLTGLGQQQNEGIAGLLATLTGQGTQRDIAGAGLDLDRARLQESSRQFGATNYLDALRTQIAQQEQESQNSWLNKLIGGIGAAGALTGGVGTLLAARRK